MLISLAIFYHLTDYVILNGFFFVGFIIDGLAILNFAGRSRLGGK